MIFLFLTLMAVITVVVLAKSKEIYFVSASFKRSKSFLFIQIFQVLVIYLGLIFADYSNKIFAIVLFLVSISEMLKLVYLKKIVNKEINLPSIPSRNLEDESLLERVKKPICLIN